MTKPTPLDRAHAIMMKAPDDEDARLAYYAMLADTEIYWLLEDEPADDVIEPQFADLEEGSFVLGFDSNERLTKFAKGTAPYAAVSCRVLAEMLVEQEAGLALNLGVADSSILLPLAAMVWMQTALEEAPLEQHLEQHAEQGNSAIGAGQGGLSMRSRRRRAALGSAGGRRAFASATGQSGQRSLGVFRP